MLRSASARPRLRAASMYLGEFPADEPQKTQILVRGTPSAGTEPFGTVMMNYSSNFVKVGSKERMAEAAGFRIPLAFGGARDFYV